ncbi:MAG: T9SS type A sorting domain-containing protein [Bacteroidaceae bacterium]|nr:T9SS type A sorting domain-containing protein [Bacteroidaceae bacterium]
MKIKEGQVTIAGNNAKDAAIYDANGRIIYKAQGSKINLNRLAKGTYLLKVGESCVKFSVRK